MNLSGSDVDGIANEFDIAQAVLEELWDRLDHAAPIMIVIV
jgi:hypothetical protein